MSIFDPDCDIDKIKTCCYNIKDELKRLNNILIGCIESNDTDIDFLILTSKFHLLHSRYIIDHNHICQELINIMVLMNCAKEFWKMNDVDTYIFKIQGVIIAINNYIES